MLLTYCTEHTPREVAEEEKEERNVADCALCAGCVVKALVPKEDSKDHTTDPENDCRQ
jgi:hypothetical protein